MRKYTLLKVITLIFILSLMKVPDVNAGEVLGIHILHPSEINKVDQLLRTEENTDSWMYVTIPFSLADVDRFAEWQQFFDECQRKKIIPLVRLLTRFEKEAWTVPTKKEIVKLTSSLSKLNWPTSERHVILFNEPNHAKEWGGAIDPESFAEVSLFAAQWLQTEPHQYVVLPAAMDLAAPNGRATMEAFTYWKRVLAATPDLLSYFDAWNSHSYPNPAFSSPPQRTGQNSLKGFKHELAFLSEYTDKKFPVFITETGWEINSKTKNQLNTYYQYAAEHIWSHPQVEAVTPFILQGAPGPFAEFSFLDAEGNKTRQFHAYRSLIEQDILTP